MEFVKKTLSSVEEFVSDHKVEIATVATAVITTAVCLAIHRNIVKDWNKFLAEENLLDKFYSID